MLLSNDIYYLPLPIGGVLYKGSRNPKRVIIDTEERRGILSHFHLDHSTGFHKSIEDTISDIQQQFFWKAIPVDAKEYVKNCQDCCQDLSSTWSQLELVTHGPFQDLYVVTLTDLASKYVLAKCVQDEDLAEEISKFLYFLTF